MTEAEVYYLMTQRTFERLVSELPQADASSKEIGKAMGEAGGTSDHHDNFAYEQYARDYGEKMSIVIKLQDKIKSAQIIEPNTDTTAIGIGHEVTLQFIPDKDIYAYTILGPSDNDPKNGWISCLTPVAIAVLGRTNGDIIIYKTPDGIKKVEVLGFRPGNF
jgi:transcription elongation factor GreA